MIRCFIGLGSNLDEPLQQIERALDALAGLDGSALGAVSPFYRNPAIGPGEQPDFINAVVELETSLTPLALLAHLQRIENSQGRVRNVRWGARTLDLDLLLYGDRIVALPELQVPHPRLRERNFVLYPLHDIAPTLMLPDDTPLTTLLDCCSAHGLQRLSHV